MQGLAFRRAFSRIGLPDPQAYRIEALTTLEKEGPLTKMRRGFRKHLQSHDSVDRMAVADFVAMNDVLGRWNHWMQRRKEIQDGVADRTRSCRSSSTRSAPGDWPTASSRGSDASLRDRRALRRTDDAGETEVEDEAFHRRACLQRGSNPGGARQPCPRAAVRHGDHPRRRRFQGPEPGDHGRAEAAHPEIRCTTTRPTRERAARSARASPT